MRAEISLGSMRASVRVNPGLDSLCPIEMLLPLPPHLSIEPLSLSLCPSPALPPPLPARAICPLPGGRWRRRERRIGAYTEGYTVENSAKNRGTGITVKLLFLQTKRFCFADGGENKKSGGKRGF